LAKGQRELTVRYDFDRIDGVAVYHPNGEFICFAQEYCPNGGIHPAAKFLGTPEDVAEYHKAANIKNSLHRATRRSAKTGLLNAAEQGFNQLVQVEVMPDVVRQQVKAAEEQAQKEAERALMTGTDGGYRLTAKEEQERAVADCKRELEYYSSGDEDDY